MITVAGRRPLKGVTLFIAMIRYGENRAYILDAAVTAQRGTPPQPVSLRELLPGVADEPASAAVISAGPRSTNEFDRRRETPDIEVVSVRLATEACALAFRGVSLPAGWQPEVLELVVCRTGVLVLSTIFVIDPARTSRTENWEEQAWAAMVAVDKLFPLVEGAVQALAVRGLISLSADFHWGTPGILRGHAELAPRDDYMADSHFFLTAESRSMANTIVSHLGVKRFSGTVRGLDVAQYWSTIVWQSEKEIADAAVLLGLLDLDSEFLCEIKVVTGAVSRYTLILLALAEGRAAELKGDELRRLVFKFGSMVRRVRESTRLLSEEGRFYYEAAANGPQTARELEAWRHYERLVLAAADGRDASDMAARERMIQVTVLAVTMILLLAVIMDAYNFLLQDRVVPPVTPGRLIVLVLALACVGWLVRAFLRRMDAHRVRPEERERIVVRPEGPRSPSPGVR